MSILIKIKNGILSSFVAIICLFVTFAAVSCGDILDDDFQDATSQLPKGHNAAIRVGSNASTRVSIDEAAGTVVWDDGDQVSLWAVDDASGEFVVETTTFDMFYYGADYNQATFTGSVDPMAQGDYTYYVTYPLAKSFEGGVATLNLPAQQDGHYGSGADLMMASAKGGALSDNVYSSCAFQFSHLTHALRITIPEEWDLLGETSKLKIKFPVPVVGNVKINLADPASAVTLSEASDMIYVDYGRPISQADCIWVFVNPAAIDGQIEFHGMTSDDVMSESIATASLSGKELLAGRITPVTLKIPEALETRYVQLKVGVNNLGEPIEKIKLTAPAGAYFLGDKSSVTLTPNADGAFEFGYVYSYFADKFAAGKITVELESKSARMTGDPISINDQTTSVTFNVPYLLAQDFSGITADSKDFDSAKSIAGCSGWTIGNYGSYWKGKSVAIHANTYKNFLFATTITNSSLTVASIPGLKPGATVKLLVKFNADWNKNEASSMKLSVDVVKISLSDVSNANEGNIKGDRSATLSGMTKDSSISWTTDSSGGGTYLSNKRDPVYIDNIKISITK